MTLVVDDDPMFLEYCRRLLAGVVLTAPTIKEGLVSARDRRPTVILLDVNFKWSRRTGVDALGAFREAAPDAELIILTEHVDEEDAARADAYGVSAVIQKDDEDRIVRAVKDAIDRARRREDQREEELRQRMAGAIAGIRGLFSAEAEAPPVAVSRRTVH
jgi:DNA-binding NarL/FixJ family response regulator